MKVILAAALILFVAGCLPYSASEGVTGHPANPDPVRSEALAPQESPLLVENQAPAVVATDLLEEVAAVDPETIEDNLLLNGADQLPPDNEGVTVAPVAVTFDFPVVENEKVRYFIDYYSGRGHGTFTRWLERSGRYLPLMRQIFSEEDLPLDLTYLAMIESGFNNRAYSWANAVGPWQFIESTGRMMGLKSDWWYDERRDFEKSTRAAARFLKDLNRRFDGDWNLAIASYNAGPGKMAHAIRKYNTRDFWEISRGKYLQLETKNYLPKLMAALIIAKEPEKYGFTDIEYQDPHDFETVQVPTATDLEVIARLCGADYETVKALNPELKRWCTPPGIRDYEVRIPLGSRERFEKGYALLPHEDRANYKRHRIAPGDTLLALSHKYKIRVADIIALNGIKNPKALRIGADLILPLKKGYTSLPVDELKDDYVRSRRQTYTVRSGDSLWKIARRFNVSEKELRVWNRLGWSNTIRPGQTLVVSAGAAKAVKPQTVAGKGTKDDGPVRKIVYKVRAGDTLWGIGKQFSVNTRQIMAWNELSADHILRPGDKLTLMVAGGSRG
ncbi:lytic transglycosylase [Desulfuromonas soudanensis]|uniref:Lytic transglycosylase n=1 Tax=Desulfuromonas soudanensis TaxID=1603606 RepID=A0A0M4D1N0_9BACT|nr:LysM peptidoglycan-binding domain-containing protein [Desulfuromonas soudanensis]ALC17002.1 lytic transglycosylase [Desulfuromonas soudanensis]